MSDTNRKPLWHKELETFSKAVSIIMLEGNVLDRFCYPEDDSIVSLREYLYFIYSDMGYDDIVFYDTLKGFYCYGSNGGKTRLAEFEKLSSRSGEQKSDVPFSADDGSCTAETAASRIELFMQQTERPVSVILDFSSRYIVSPDAMSKQETNSFFHLQKGGLSASAAKNKNGVLLGNVAIIITNKINDLPAWFYLNNPSVHIITINKPDSAQREHFVNGRNFRSFFDAERWTEGMKYYDNHPEELKNIKSSFVTATDGLMYADLVSISKICSSMKLDIKNLRHAVEVFKYGIIEQNPWTKIDARTIDELRLRLNKQILLLRAVQKHGQLFRAYQAFSFL